MVPIDEKECQLDLKDMHQALLDHSFDAIVSIDTEGAILGWNLSAESTFGWKAEEVVGKKLSEVLIPEKYRAAHTEGLRRFMHTGKARVLNQHLELSALHRNGGELPVEISIVPSRQNGRVVFTGIIRDITESKNAIRQAQLREEEYKILHEVAQALQNSNSMEAMLREALGAISRSKELHVENKAGIFLADQEKQVLRLAVRIGKFPAGFLKNLKEIPFYNIPYGRCFTSGEMVVRDWCMFYPQQPGPFGKENQYGSYIVPLKCRNETMGVLFLYTPESPPCYEGSRDVLRSIAALIGNAIKHRQYEKEIQKQNKQLRMFNFMKNRFLGIASHDLRNPIYLILTYCSILAEGSLGKLNDRQEKIIDKIIYSGEYMRDLLSNLLDISKIESGQFHLDKKPANFNLLVQSQVEMSQQLADKKQIRLEFFPDELPDVAVDKCSMIQVVDNLVGNAIKFSPPGARVIVSTRKNGNRWRFSVEDEGPGLDKEEMALAFEEFQTLSAKPTGGEKATGLGLAISKKIINLHGGEMGVESEKEMGSTFYFDLPI
ncbi:sensor histidine kinase [Nitrospina gracilis]|uniref:sensor histidine kinase n=1 Tax=Nitrospina gracilis TaxID=35801 RepID=UPI001F23839C|nr:ATP-binding protein [Nitrospina gracilis]